MIYSHRPMPFIIRRSFTLLELIIAIALVLGLSSMLIPAMLQSMEERAFESAREATDDQLALARAHSQETGEPVEVVYRANPSRVETRILGALAEDDVDGGIGPLGTWPETRASRPGASHRSVVLGDGVTMTARRPASSPGDQWLGSISANSYTHPAETLHEHASDSQGSAHDVRLAVFMPDGSAVAHHPVWLRDEEGRLCRLTINPWTGFSSFERIYDDEDAQPWAGEDEDSIDAILDDAIPTSEAPSPVSPYARSSPSYNEDADADADDVQSPRAPDDERDATP